MPLLRYMLNPPLVSLFGFIPLMFSNKHLIQGTQEQLLSIAFSSLIVHHHFCRLIHLIHWIPIPFMEFLTVTLCLIWHCVLLFRRKRSWMFAETVFFSFLSEDSNSSIFSCPLRLSSLSELWVCLSLFFFIPTSSSYSTALNFFLFFHLILQTTLYVLKTPTPSPSFSVTRTGRLSSLRRKEREISLFLSFMSLREEGNFVTESSCDTAVLLSAPNRYSQAAPCLFYVPLILVSLSLSILSPPKVSSPSLSLFTRDCDTTSIDFVSASDREEEKRDKNIFYCIGWYKRREPDAFSRIIVKEWLLRERRQKRKRDWRGITSLCIMLLTNEIFGR